MLNGLESDKKRKKKNGKRKKNIRKGKKGKNIRRKNYYNNMSNFIIIM